LCACGSFFGVSLPLDPSLYTEFTTGVNAQSTVRTHDAEKRTEMIKAAVVITVRLPGRWVRVARTARDRLGATSLASHRASGVCVCVCVCVVSAATGSSAMLSIRE